MQKQIKRIAIVCGYPFPAGLAPTVRILTYARGLVEQKVETEVFIYFPTDKTESDMSVDGEIYGVKFHYPLTRTYPKNLVLRKLSHPYYTLVTSFRIILESRKKKFDYLFISSDWLRILFTFVGLSKMLKTKVIFVADEYPVPIRKYLKNDIPRMKRLLYKIILQYVDAMVFMTKNLSVFYSEMVKKPIFILPCITDLTRFKQKSTNSYSEKYLCYMGNFELTKDNVTNIIEAFYRISKKYPWLNLRLYGKPSSIDREIIIKLIQKLSLQERVLLMGRVANEVVPMILSQSFILVSSQPFTQRASGGFPTKLGEYLATGVPTLMTSVGEIEDYIEDGTTAWLVEPENPELYAKKLSYIIDNYEVALHVASNGKRFVQNAFDYSKLSANLLHFLQTMPFQSK